MSWEGAAKWVVGINGKKDDVQHEDFPEVTHPSTTLAQARLAAEFDGIRCISAGMIAPAKCCAINGYMDSTKTPD
ncbi:unnamed protein product [Sphenostylis stenocarpa]|uniref:Uncharacterized protein n=1 Tax=Sphenostylis stenocarpa TaxID=92480 RepID=A0AA86VX06_9FABA|nr:unnamed protein product [Sphenostylis stenocarpa]